MLGLQYGIAKSPQAKEILIAVGLPGSGKSTWINAHLRDHSFLCADKIKTLHPAYDPQHPEIVHRWSAGVVDGLFSQIIHQGTGHWVIESTGSNLNRLRIKIDLAHRAGFRTGLIYFTCSLETALIRNSLRERHVPEKSIIEKSKVILDNYWLLSKLVDSSLEINTETSL